RLISWRTGSRALERPSTSARPTSACCGISCSSHAGSFRASSCSTRYGARTRKSNCAPLMSIFGDCAKRSTKPAPETCCGPCARSATPSTGPAELGPASADQQAYRDYHGGGFERPDSALGIDERGKRRGAPDQQQLVDAYLKAIAHSAGK